MATATSVIFRACGLGSFVGSVAGAGYGAACGLFIGAISGATVAESVVSVASYGLILGAGAGLVLGLVIGLATVGLGGGSQAGQTVRTGVAAVLWTAGAAALFGGSSMLLQPDTETVFLAALLLITLPAWIAAMLGWKLIASFVDRYSPSTSFSPASSR